MSGGTYTTTHCIGLAPLCAGMLDLNQAFDQFTSWNHRSSPDTGGGRYCRQLAGILAMVSEDGANDYIFAEMLQGGMLNCTTILRNWFIGRELEQHIVRCDCR